MIALLLAWCAIAVWIAILVSRWLGSVGRAAADATAELVAVEAVQEAACRNHGAATFD